jgi:hypothetical protein
MNRLVLKRKLDEMGVNENDYSLYGSLDWNKIILYENYSNWEVFYLSERGTRDNFHVFHSEEEACQYIFNEFQKSLKIRSTTPKLLESKRTAMDLMMKNGYVETISNMTDKVLFSEVCSWSFLAFIGYCVEIQKVENTYELFSQLANKLCLRNFKYSWDDLMSCFQDFSWIDNTDIYIIHHDLSCLSSQDINNYYEVIYDTIHFWDEKKEHKVYFIFSKDEKDRFFQMLTKEADQKT